MNMIFVKGEVPSNFNNTIIKSLYKKADKSDCCIYSSISLVSVGSKLLCIMILFRLRDAIDIVLREEQYGYRKDNGSVDHIYTLRFITA